MLRIAICDDDKILVTQIEEMLNRYLDKKMIDRYIDIFYDGASLERIYEKGDRFDIIYLDIEMSGKNGIEAAKSIRKLDRDVLLIYVSSYETYFSPITMLVMMESIQNRIVENGKRGKATWLYIDEFHVLLNSEYSAKYLQQLWKKVRKQGGLCTGITQNVVDLLQNYTATTMLANSEFVALLKQANTDSSKMAEVIGVSEAQLRFVTNTASGMGLIKCGSVVIPFDNQISKDTDLYRLYNTNIHEKIAEQKKKEAMLQ